MPHHYLSESWVLLKVYFGVLWAVLGMFLSMLWEFLMFYPRESIVFFGVALICMLRETVLEQIRKPALRVYCNAYFWLSLVCAAWTLFLCYVVGLTGRVAATRGAEAAALTILIILGVGLVVALSQKRETSSSQSDASGDS